MLGADIPYDRDHLDRVWGVRVWPGVVRGPVLAELDRAEFCSVAQAAPWGVVLAEPITRVQAHWLDVRWGDQDTTGGRGQPVSATGDDIVVLWQRDIIPVLSPFLPADQLGP